MDWMLRIPVGARTPGHAIDLPWASRSVREREDFGEAVANDSSHADHQAHTLVASWWNCYFGFVYLLQKTMKAEFNLQRYSKWVY